MLDWRYMLLESDWTAARITYTEERDIVQSFANLPLFHCPDLVIEAEDIATRIRIYEEVRI